MFVIEDNLQYPRHYVGFEFNCLSDPVWLYVKYPSLIHCSNMFTHFLIEFSRNFRFPLYSKGKEGTKFFYGAFLLNKDIAQVGLFKQTVRM
mgnify:CR=1 FL=1